MSFDIDVSQVLQYAFNIFGSMQTMLYLFIGASFGLYILYKIMKIVRGD